MREKWWVTRDKKTVHGPFSREKLKEFADFGKLRPTDFVRPDGTAAWTLTSSVEGLFAPIPVAAVAVVVPARQPSNEILTVVSVGESQAKKQIISAYFLFTVGMLIAMFSGIWLIRALMMDTTVAVHEYDSWGSIQYGRRVHNAGLIQEKTQNLILSLFGLGIGIALVLIDTFYIIPRYSVKRLK